MTEVLIAANTMLLVSIGLTIVAVVQSKNKKLR